ncbi:hypothetical protein H8356DRAFT_422729 [Neocallimastix lanati (nom. inval.)]|nr:hypothetical protein H8356DRAFT_422729 [Neocallimastix sp. JGI-2020a]
MFGNKDRVEYLVEHGADINKENKYNKISLFKAIKSGNKDLVEYLVKHGSYLYKKINM